MSASIESSVEFTDFTARAKRLVGLAGQEAIRLSSDFLGTPHLLRAILLDWRETPPDQASVIDDSSRPSVAALMLGNLLLRRSALLKDLDRLMPINSPAQVALRLAMTPTAKLALSRAVDEAHHLGHQCVTSGHLLLGIMRDSDGVAAQLIRRSRRVFEEFRSNLLSLASDTDLPPGDDRFWPEQEAKRVSA